jgi:hypothetical protein
MTLLHHKPVLTAEALAKEVMMHADFDAGCWTLGVRRLLLILQPCHANSSCGGRVAVESANIASSIVSLDWPFDNLGLLSEKFRQMLFYVVRGQTATPKTIGSYHLDQVAITFLNGEKARMERGGRDYDPNEPVVSPHDYSRATSQMTLMLRCNDCRVYGYWCANR